MRIAYIAPYQGPSLPGNRPSLQKLSLAGNVKIELIAELLRRSSHELEILSVGEVDKFACRFYRSFKEAEPFNPSVPVYYASALPIRFLSGLWSSMRMRRLLKARHKVSPFDLVIIYNLKRAHLACVVYATRRLALPVILEYEDDSFRDVVGREDKGLIQRFHRSQCRRALGRMSGCTAVSPYLLSQLPPSTPKLLLRGIVGQSILDANRHPRAPRRNWVVFSGTLDGTQGEAQMIKAWEMLGLPEWELHIAGRGPILAALRKQAEHNRSIVFHGFLNREENARLLCPAKIGLNPQDVTQVPGTSFAFKIIEYLAAGLHVITTPRGAVEPELEVGITYIADNAPGRIAACLKQIISNRLYENTAERAALQIYGPEAIEKGLCRLVEQAATGVVHT